MSGISDCIVFEPAQLREAAAQPSTILASPFEKQPALLLRSAPAAADLCDEERAAVAAWLACQPCPIIGIGNPHTLATDPWCAQYDVWVDDLASAEPLLRNIRHAPHAATVLVQTLRLTSHLPVMEGLLVESLAYASVQTAREFHHWLSTQHRPTSTSSTVTHEPAVLMEREGDHLKICLNRPERRNALSVEMRDALLEALHLVQADSTLRRVSLRGAGDSFSIGGDLDEFGTAPDSASAHLIRSVCLPARTLHACIAQGQQLTFHLQGACIGAGVELPAFAQRVVATPKTFFQLPEIRFGLIPGAGGCVSLPRRIGRHRTAWLALSTRRINAATALAWGLVDGIAQSIDADSSQLIQPCKTGEGE